MKIDEDDVDDHQDRRASVYDLAPSHFPDDIIVDAVSQCAGSCCSCGGEI